MVFAAPKESILEVDEEEAAGNNHAPFSQANSKKGNDRKQSKEYSFGKVPSQ